VAESTDVMADQLDHLRSSPADVRILPFSAGPVPRSSFWAMFEFDDSEDPPVVYVEGGRIGRYLDKPADWAEYETVWAILMERAVPIREWPR
jgi:hypothetical protein